MSGKGVASAITWPGHTFVVSFVFVWTSAAALVSTDMASKAV